MRLHEAYEHLEWGTPLTFERAGIARGLRDHTGPRHVGTSAHMLVELYLDMERASRVAGTDFVVVCTHVRLGRYLRQWLETIHRMLDLDVDTKRVQFLPLSSDTERLRGLRWYSWAVFCDHTVKDDDQERNLGPYRLVRALEMQGDYWVAFDRDGNRVCKLTDQGMRELADAATCPLTLRGSGLKGTTYPAYQGADAINRCVLLREAFAR